MAIDRLKEQLLREYIRNLLAESEGGGGDSGGGGHSGADSTPISQMGMGPMGDSSALGKIFFQPFADVAKTVLAQSKIVFQKAKTLLRVVIETVITTIVPFVSSDYNKIFAEDRAAVDKIKSQYKDVYDRTNNAFKGDAAVFAFVMAPGAYLAANAAKASPKALSGLLSTLTGGASDKYLKESYNRGALLRELEEKGQEKKDPNYAKKIDAMLKDPAVIAALKKNIGPMREEIINNTKETIKKSVEFASKVINAKSASDIGKALSKNITVDSIKKKLGPEAKNISDEELKQMLEKLPDGSTDFLKQTFVAPLQQKLESTLDDGLKAEYEKAISTIQKM